MSNNQKKIYEIGSRAVYRITVKGKLDEGWSGWFNDTSLSVVNDSAGKPCTQLTSIVRDQAELFGILSKLNSLNLYLVKVDLVD